MTPSPTDAELDELQHFVIATADSSGKPGRKVADLIKALRACRAQSKAKDAVIEKAYIVMHHYDRTIGRSAMWRSPSWTRLRDALAALDKTDD